MWGALSLAAINLMIRASGVLLAALGLWVGLLVYVPVLALGCLLVGLIAALLGGPGLLMGLGWVAAVSTVAALTERELLLDHVENRAARYMRRFLHRWRWDNLMTACGLTTRDDPAGPSAPG